MAIGKSVRRVFLAWPMLVVGHLTLITSAVVAQAPNAQPLAIQPIPALNESLKNSLSGPVVPSALSLRHVPADGQAPAQVQPNEHPLLPLLRWAKQDLPAIEGLKDYSAVLVRRERVRGKLTGYEYVFVKIRHQPFSVYAHFQAPASVQGQEVIYVAGQNQGNLLAHKAHMRATLSLLPEGMIAMSGRHYPITEIGLVNLVRRLVEVGERDVNYGECEVKYFSGAAVNKRPCTVIQVVHPTPRDVFRFHLARVFVDDELKIPLRYESYDWFRESGGQPELIEEYSYLDLKLNNGFTDEDFSTRNPSYQFQQSTAVLGQSADSR